ncbi:MAG: (deoxy)nucleoside triphosphate pyrophosphohydrolase [Syntrophales bacterium]|nr:(deoxy)nucleoside triphosphate pyrophosphohydrolase [Syntrophales bacterium]MDD5233405.1 (deoxy)nucleoside triphosphate pyrophosphohydrolase [Syntrophales bacterium]MDD5533082.1 (deoxy)nucleoside triphosphate pyrophosphohydrolase [Syntrophales bacterium]
MQIVTAAVIEKEGKILIARRRKGEAMEGFWEFPGGKLEHEETPEACLARELHEEFGIEVSVGDFYCSSRFLYRHGEIDLKAYRAEIVSGEITLQVHDEIRWVRPEELLNFRLTEADIPIAENLAKEVQGKNLR